MIKPALENYDIICSWWQKYNYPIQPEEQFSRGNIVFINDKPIFAGVMFVDDSCGVGVMTYPVYNPEANSEERRLAFAEYTNHLRELAKQIGVTMILTDTGNKSFMSRLEKNGFKIADTNVSTFYLEV